MSREETKEDLQFYLCDPKIRVVALKGLWGTGKTHLWDKVKPHIRQANGQDHVYASCFGLENIEQLKMALFQSSLGKADEAISKLKTIGKGISGAIEKAVTTFFPGADGLTSIAGGLGGLVQSALIERALKDRLVVLDDVERRGKTLEAEAILGFIDFLKRNNCRILLILNEEPMEEALHKEWRILKEKCIDRELTLLTSPREAAQIGLGDEVIDRELVITTLEKIGVSNIRVIQRIDRVLSAVFQGRKQIHESVAHSLIPAVVILTSLNFNAIHNAPSLFELMADWAKWSDNPSFIDTENITENVKFGISHNLTSDIEFLRLIESHITTGKRFKDEFKNLIEQREIKATNNEAENAAIWYIQSTYLDPQMTDGDFISIANQYKTQWASLSPDKISAIANDLQARSQEQLNNELLDLWAVNARQKQQLWLSHFYSPEHFHPAVRDIVIEINEEIKAKRPKLIEAVHQVSTGGWAPDDEEVINAATMEEVKTTILELDRENFGTFVHFYTSQLKTPTVNQNNKAIFSEGSSTCLECVREMISNSEHPQIVRLLEIHFGELLKPKGPLTTYSPIA